MSEVFVKTTKRVESDTELFANYGTNFRFAVLLITSKQPLMVRTFLKVYMELGSNFCFCKNK